MLWVALHFPSLPSGTLEHIAAWACQFTPKVSLEPPQALLAEVEGSLRYFGGMGGLLEKLRTGLSELGFEAALATAATPRAALWRARAGGTKLEEVPLSATGVEAAFFKSIGVSTVGELLRLPREGLARRCGQALLDDLDRALGKAPEARKFFAPPQRFAAKLELPAEVTHAEGLLFAARRLLVRLEGLLAARHEGVRGFVLTLIGSKTAFASIEVRLASPSRDAGRFSELLGERLAALSLTRPVEAVRVEARDFAPLHARTAEMFGDPAGEEENWARLLERLRARLGHDGVYAVATHPDHRPEYAWRRIEPGDWDPHEPRSVGPRPLWLARQARRLGEVPFDLLAGPERIESGWWDGDDARRDYFVAQFKDSSLVWVYREAGEWFLHGFFA